MGDTDLALYEVKLRALFAGLYTQARSSKQRVNYKIATKELLQFCKLTNLAVNKEECKSILKSKSTDGKIKFEEFFYCFKKLTSLGDISLTPEIPTLSLDPSPRQQRKKSVGKTRTIYLSRIIAWQYTIFQVFTYQTNVSYSDSN